MTSRYEKEVCKPGSLKKQDQRTLRAIVGLRTLEETEYIEGTEYILSINYIRI